MVGHIFVQRQVHEISYSVKKTSVAHFTTFLHRALLLKRPDYFSILPFSILVATQIPFRYLGKPPGQNVPMNNIPNNEKKAEETTKDKLKKAKVFAQTLRGMPNFILVFKAMANLRMLMCMLVAWVMGIGMGLIFTFLFWHLQVC